MTRNALAAVLLSLAVPLQALAAALVVTPKHSLEVRFSIPEPPPLFEPSGEYNVLLLAYTLSAPAGSATGHTASLFNGTELLGTHASSDPRAFYFAGSNGLIQFTYDSAPLVDYSSVLDASIEGRVLVSVSAGQLSLDPQSVYVLIGSAVGSGTTISTQGGPRPSILSVSLIPIPEPGTVLQVLAGLALLCIVVARRTAATIPSQRNLQ